MHVRPYLGQQSTCRGWIEGLTKFSLKSSNLRGASLRMKKEEHHYGMIPRLQTQDISGVGSVFRHGTPQPPPRSNIEVPSAGTIDRFWN